MEHLSHTSSSEPKTLEEFRLALEQELSSPEAAELPASDRAFFESLLSDEELLARFIFPDAS